MPALNRSNSDCQTGVRNGLNYSIPHDDPSGNIGLLIVVKIQLSSIRVNHEVTAEIFKKITRVV
jgi:hypothetical protein